MLQPGLICLQKWSIRRRRVLAIFLFLSSVLWIACWSKFSGPVSEVLWQRLSQDTLKGAVSGLKNSSAAWEGLTSDAVLQLQQDNGTIIIMVATSGYGEMFASMVCRLHLLQLENFVLVAVDDAAYDMCKKNNYPAFRAAELLDDSSSTSLLQRDGARFNSLEFKSIAKIKEKAVLRALSLGLNVVLTDVDIVWLRNPMPLFFSEKLEEYDFLVQSDAYSWLAPLHEMNSGFYFVRSTKAAINTMKYVIKIGSSNPEMREQTAFHRALCGQPGIWTHIFWKLECISPQNARVWLLPRKLFPNGHNFLVDYGPRRSFSFFPYIIHFNWILGAGRKEYKIKAYGLWSAGEDGSCLPIHTLTTSNKGPQSDTVGLFIFLGLVLISFLALAFATQNKQQTVGVSKSE